MFCPNCGKEIKGNSKFCGNCGTIIEGDSPQTTQPQFTTQQTAFVGAIKKKLNKKIIAAVSVVGIAIVAIVIFISMYNQPEAKMNRAISSGNIKEAYQIYKNELTGKSLSEKTLNAFKDAANSAASDYENGSISYEAAQKVLEDIEDFAFWADIPSSITSDAENKIRSLYNYKSYIESAEEYYSEKDYLNALKNYKYALELNKDSTEASDGIAKSENAYRADIISQADDYISDRDYSSAESILNTGLYNLNNDTALKEKLNSINDIKVKNIVDDAYSYTKGGDWDSAVELLEEAQSQYSSNQAITDAYKDIKDKMPITLKNIVTISSAKVEIKREVMKDRYGNIYDGAVRYNGQTEGAFGLYNLSGNYKTFTTTAFVGVEARVGRNHSISVYVDDTLVLFKEKITDESAPEKISLDVEGKQTLKIVVKTEGSYSYDDCIYFGESSFEKVDGLGNQE